MDEALGWLDRKKGGKFFAWIHLYDPHTPYEPPEPFRSSYGPNAYLARSPSRTVSWPGSRLHRPQRAAGEPLPRLARHGESLGEHEESTHASSSTRRPPRPADRRLAVQALQGVTSPETVGLVDIMPRSWR